MLYENEYGFLRKLLNREVKYTFIEDKDPVSHRTKYRNMMAKTVKTPFLAVWDVDVLVDKSQIIDTTETVMQPQKKLAFCITCMNRLSHIQETLVKNMEDNFSPNEVEFILLDYNSTDGLEEWVKTLQNYIDIGILHYYRTDIPTHYHRSHSRNFDSLRLYLMDTLSQ